MLIRMKDFTDSAFDKNVAEMLKNKIEEALKQEDTVTIDFTGIECISKLFFNFSLANYAKDYGKAWYDKTFNIINLTDFGNKIYSRFYRDAVEHPKKYTPEQEKYIKNMLDNLDE